jgi:uncharacterized protein (TIGR00369 family)
VILPPPDEPEVPLPSDDTLQTYLDEAPLHALLGGFSVGATETGVVLQGSLSAAAENAAGSAVAHGGAAATLLDTALTFALIAETDRDWTTVDLRVDYLRPVPIAGVQVIGEVVHAGRRVGRAQGELLAHEGSVCARAVGTFVTSE